MTPLARALLAGAFAAMAAQTAAGQPWDPYRGARREAWEGQAEVNRERREATREILTADSPWEARHEYREGRREIERERREARREVRREVREANWRY